MTFGKVEGTTYTPGTQSTGFFDGVRSGMKAPFMASNEVADKTTVVYTAIMWGLVGFLTAKIMS